VWKSAWDQVKQYCKRALDVYESADNELGRLRCDICNTQNLILSTGGRHEETTALLNRCLETSRRLGARVQESEVLSTQAIAVLLTGEFPETMEVLDQLKVLYEEVGNREGLATEKLLRASYLTGRGHLDEAYVLAKEGAAMFEELKANRLALSCRATSGFLALIKGDPVDECIKTMDDVYETFRRAGSAYRMVGVRVCTLLGLAIRDRFDLAKVYLLEGADLDILATYPRATVEAYHLTCKDINRAGKPLLIRVFMRLFCC